MHTAASWCRSARGCSGAVVGQWPRRPGHLASGAWSRFCSRASRGSWRGALAVLGWQAYRQMAFPLAFLVFAVPFGRALVPALMQVTADITVTVLNWTGVPGFPGGMLLSIPGGDFEVARACSGLNYLMTGVVLGTLYAHLMYTGWRKRVAFVAVTVAVLIVANGIRAYLTVAI